MFHFSPSYSINHENEREKLDKEGWNYFSCFFYPPAGPRCLHTMGFLPKLKKTLVERDKNEKWLISGSMGTLCFLSLITSMHTNKSFIDQPNKLVDAFLQMSYHPKMGVDGGQKALNTMMNELFMIAAPDPKYIVEHPRYHIIIIVNCIKWNNGFMEKIMQNKWTMILFFLCSALMHTIFPHFYTLFQKRCCFYSGPNPCHLFGSDTLKTTQFVKLNEMNLHQVLHATTCIPFISRPCHFIHGLGKGIFYDAGFSDYHLNMNMLEPTLQLSANVKGENALSNIWSMSSLFRNLDYYHKINEHISTLSVTNRFVNCLSICKLPTLFDFFTLEYIRNPLKRIKLWHEVYHLSCRYMMEKPI